MLPFSSRGECDCCSSSKDDNHLDHAKARQSQDAQAKQGDPTLGLSMEDGNRVVELIRAQEQARIHADNMARMKSSGSERCNPCEPCASDEVAGISTTLSAMSDELSGSKTLFAAFRVLNDLLNIVFRRRCGWQRAVPPRWRRNPADFYV